MADQDHPSHMTQAHSVGWHAERRRLLFIDTDTHQENTKEGGTMVNLIKCKWTFFLAIKKKKREKKHAALTDNPLSRKRSQQD